MTKKQNRSSKYIITPMLRVGYILTFTLLFVFLLSSFSGKLNPNNYALAPFLNMAFPIILLLVIATTIFWAIIRKWNMVVISIVVALICSNSIYTFSPLNIFNSKPTITEQNKDEYFTVMTYNIFNFWDLTQKRYDIPTPPNTSISYILEKNPDIVVIQEGSTICPFYELKFLGSELSELLKQYPYYQKGMSDIIILSKYPYKILNRKVWTEYRFNSVSYEVEIKGHKLDIVGVHLASIGLTQKDKATYKKLTKISEIDSISKNMEEAKKSIFSKLCDAFEERADQATEIKKYMNTLGDNVILCGDFNDTQSSYAYHTIKGDDMTDAYKKCAFGPTITYHLNRFFFRIDHMLYKGNFEAVSIERGNIKSSDHYPLLTTFKWTK